MAVDNTLDLLFEGYGWLPNRRRRVLGDVVHTRLAGHRAVALCGPEAARFFYDEEHIERHGAMPGPVKSTLLGRKTVHSLDGAAHRARKAMFTAILADDGDIALLTERTVTAWDDAVATWADRDSVVLFDETSRVVTSGVCHWAGIDLEDSDVPDLAADLVAMVDGFATPGPRHMRARRARRRRESWMMRLLRDRAAESTRTSGPMAAVHRSGVRGSLIEAVAGHRDADGRPLDTGVAATELLNFLRPTVAVTWFVTFAAHALHRWPEHRARLSDPAYCEAFTQEVRRFYPFAPFVGGRAIKDLSWQGEVIPKGALVLLDVYGQHHDPRVWVEPYDFIPERFLAHHIGAFDLIPQGGGDPRTTHRCPGEKATLSLLQALVPRLARLSYDVPRQDLTIPLNRIPTRPASGFILTMSPTRARPTHARTPAASAG